MSKVQKLFERITFTQINSFRKNKLSVLLIGFGKNYNTQHSLVSMIENWKNTLDKGTFVAAIFLDLSQAFDTWVRITTFFSSWVDIFLGVPQGSILSPVLFNILFHDLFAFTHTNKLQCQQLCFKVNLEEIKQILHCDFEKITKWFYENYMA